MCRKARTATETGVAVGEEALPAIYAQRRANRGFEAVALRDGILYAFIQSTLDNPDDAEGPRFESNANLVRILAFDTQRRANRRRILLPARRRRCGSDRRRRYRPTARCW
jgi:hypothetical protein